MICTDPVKLSMLILSVRSLHRFIYFIHVRIPCKTVQKIPSKDIPLDTIILFYVLSVIYPRNDKKTISQSRQEFYNNYDIFSNYKRIIICRVEGTSKQTPSKSSHV